MSELKRARVASFCLLFVMGLMNSVARASLTPQGEIVEVEENGRTMYTIAGVTSPDAACLKPIERHWQEPAWLHNPKANLGEFRGHYVNLKGRYLVVDLDRRDENGMCKGVKEVIPQALQESKPQYKPVVRAGTEQNGCPGQTMTLCEINPSFTRVTMMARFAISAGKGEDYKDYYAAVNIIRTRHGDKRAPDTERDKFWNGKAPGKSDEVLLLFEGVDPMLNFLNFVPAAGLKGETQNGIHRYPSGTRHILGEPASHGCLRTSDFGSRFVRDWTPLGAKLFVLHKAVKLPGIP